MSRLKMAAKITWQLGIIAAGNMSFAGTVATATPGGDLTRGFQIFRDFAKDGDMVYALGKDVLANAKNLFQRRNSGEDAENADTGSAGSSKGFFARMSEKYTKWTDPAGGLKDVIKVFQELKNKVTIGVPLYESEYKQLKTIIAGLECTLLQERTIFTGTRMTSDDKSTKSKLKKLLNKQKKIKRVF
jgi:hypothetical protein